MPIVAKEKILRPRILLIDFNEETYEALKSQGYNVFTATSGLARNSVSYPAHASEFELVFWNCAVIEDPLLPVMSAISGRFSEPPSTALRRKAEAAITHGHEYSRYVRSKGGMTVLFLGEEMVDARLVSKVVGYNFFLTNRKTSTIFPLVPANSLETVLERYVLDRNIRFSILWNDNFVDYHKYFFDEDNNHFAAYAQPGLLIVPFVDDVSQLMLDLLQDVLPNECSDEIFPDKDSFIWLKDDAFTSDAVRKLEFAKVMEKAEHDERIAALDKEIQIESDAVHYLRQALVADDSEKFDQSEQLKAQVAQMLEGLGFEVKDVDAEKKAGGFDLSEDLQITGGSKIGLVEVKGTDGGAKATWINKDIQSHMTKFSAVTKLPVTGFHTYLVFSHERRIDPRERSNPFNGFKELPEVCESQNITAVPIFELYKLCVAVREGSVNQENARNQLEGTGLYTFKSVE